ncbi:NAD(P)/FAD-dependent oxidoreductase [Anaeromyxobacter diazotrophicus]|uniref:Pyridine nucleotide-disulfide oxidoreductase n=1 Tax=Anaeromyxobacter diazotrophicus TaxID=2590199 RepID=A0A7I9VGL3_9BACT|nr:FAD-dependent oxidoreductase [Anaeromyxobacter diazotrophicus]GEJ55475.1 pyridine nucleotide-disulfide oxidoreductase [Anaeromyxobacter diazotrophicus]
MAEFKYVVIGGGMTGHAAAQGIRSVDAAGSIAIVGDEPARPYARPPLTKGLWTGQEEGSIWLPAVEGVSLRAGERAIAIDRGARRVTLEGGESLGYERLLLATGGTPRRLPFADAGVVYYRTVADYRRVRALPVGKHVAVVGGGFIGSELAASLTTAGHRVTLLFPERGIGARLFPPDLSEHLNAYYAEREVEVRPQERLTGVEARGGGFVLRTDRGELRADLVVAGLGIVPDDGLAARAGLAVDDGILVDEGLRTSDPAVFAAGDVARFPNPALGQRIRVEHEDNANRMGREAGRAMAGAAVAYRHLPFFYSDLFDLGYEAVGVLDPRLEVVADWTERFRKGVVHYLSGGRVRGVLTWGIFGKMDAARALISEPGPHDAATLRGRISG